MSNKTLVAYYSHSHNTEKIAKLIAAQAGADLVAIVPKNPYPADYNSVVAQAKQEIGANYLPPIETTAINLGSYDTVFVGSPNWWSTIAPPLGTFLASNDLSHKTVVPFITHGGGGQARLFGDIAKLCPGAKLPEGFAEYNDGNSQTQSKIATWLAGLNLAK